MANPPGDGTNLRFIIKKYPNGAFSSQLDGELERRRRRDRQGAVWHLLPAGRTARPDAADRRRLRHVAAVVDPGRSHRRAAKQRPVRFFYGARTRADLFYLDELAAIAAQLPDFKFIPALSHAEAG